MSTTTDRPKVSLRQFWAGLPTSGRWLLCTVAIQKLGRGLTLPFTVIYINEVRGIGLGTAGTLLALIAVVALIVTGPGGSLTDRIGARRMLIAGTFAQLVGCTVLGFATSVPILVVGFVLLGFNFGVSWPAFNALIASVVSGPLRQQYYGVNFALVNLGIGLGGVVGGLFVDVDKPSTFTLIFLADAVSMLVPIGLLLGPLRHVHGRAERSADTPAVGYLDILRRPPVLWLTFITFLCTFIGYGQTQSGFPAFSRQVGEVSTQVIGLAFAIDTLVIVVMQFPVLQAVTGRRRTRVLLVMVGLWITSWAILSLAGLGPAALVATVSVVMFMGVFGFGEIFMQIAIPAYLGSCRRRDLRDSPEDQCLVPKFGSRIIWGGVIDGQLLLRPHARLWSGRVGARPTGFLLLVPDALVLVGASVEETPGGGIALHPGVAHLELAAVSHCTAPVSVARVLGHVLHLRPDSQPPWLPRHSVVEIARR